MKLKVYNMEAKEVSEIELPDRIFGTKWNPDLVHQVVTSLKVNVRQPAHTKMRSEVRGGGRKPWRQKGTGRARHGSIRSPLWIGGGVTHGPRKEKDYSKKLNKKMKKAALFSVLSRKAAEGELIVIDSIDFPSEKTKYASALLSHLEQKKIIKPAKSVLVLLDKKQAFRAFRNLPRVLIEEVRNINSLEALSNKYLLFSKESINGII